MMQSIYRLAYNAVPTSLDLPKLEYEIFYEAVLHNMESKGTHCVHYFALREQEELLFYCILADDDAQNLKIFHFQLQALVPNELESLSKAHPAFHLFERQISEQHGVRYLDHPWPKPVSYPPLRARGEEVVENYPFYKMASRELHEVGVGPIHAGVIEPGHFRFICHGEQVHHLEIQLGYQHRGVEWLYAHKPSIYQHLVLAESTSGDAAIAHALAYIHAVEGLTSFEPNTKLTKARTIALELERIAVHVGGLSAFCQDIAYQLGSSVFGALRTPIINFVQSWCGNRFGKGLIRPTYTPYSLDARLREQLVKVLDDFDKKYMEMAHTLFDLPSVLNRFEHTGVLSATQAEQLGAVGIAACMSGLKRDVRWSHPHDYFEKIPYEPTLYTSGDVYARAQLRNVSIQKSLGYIRTLLTQMYSMEDEPTAPAVPLHTLTWAPNSMVVSMVESWRGELAYVVCTDASGTPYAVKVKDPSMHNWLALALVMRGNEISDFPICNKSFDLSYCGHDL